jgi:hypothetical protein
MSLFVQLGFAGGRSPTSASDQRHELGTALTQLLKHAPQAALREGHLLGDLVVNLLQTVLLYMTKPSYNHHHVKTA